MNELHKPHHKPALPFRAAMFAKPYDLSGGRCRARTYDPLIKSQPIPADFIAENFKPGPFIPNTHQCVSPVSQTTPVIKKVPRPLDPKGLGASSARLCAAGCGGGRMA